MSLVGSKVFEVGGKQNRRSCICGQASCAKTSALFRSLGDARGCMFSLPSLGGTRNVDMKRHKLARIIHHLGLGVSNIEQYASVDTRNRSSLSPSPTKRPRSAKKSPKASPARTKKAVAVHHFHPEVVQLAISSGSLSLPDYLTESFLVESGLWQNGYTDADEYDGEIKPNGTDVEKVYAPVSGYKYAEDDYKLAATRYRINDIVKKCTDATFGHSFLGRRGEHDEL